MSMFVKVLASLFTVSTVMFAVLFLNFSIITGIIIGNEEAYDTENKPIGSVFSLFYTISSDTGYHPEPSNFNLGLTIAIGAALGLFISYHTIWRRW